MQWACAILSSVAFPALQYFFTLPKKGAIFEGEKSLVNIKKERFLKGKKV